jgi:DNA polymerase-3 subunit delta
MLAERRVVVVRDVDKLKKDARTLLDDYLKRPAPDCVLLLVAPSGVKSDKGLSDRSTAVEFAPLTGDRLPKWIAYQVETVLGRTITPEAISLLVEAVGEDLSQLAVELEKLASFSDSVIDEAAVADVVGVRREESTGALLDAIAARDAARAMELLPIVLQQPKVNAVVLTMHLTTQTMALAYGEAARARGVQPRSLYNEFMSLLKETGAFPGRPWGEAVNAWTKYSDRWSRDALDSALAILLTTDEALKDTRVSSDEQVFTSLVLALCGEGTSRRAA